MKKIALIALSSLFISANATASEAPVAYGADFAAGFKAWQKDLKRYGKKEGVMLSHAVDAWLKELERVARTKK